MSGDRAVELLISKIYNWPISEGTPDLELVFLPQHGHPPPLLATTVPTTHSRNCLTLQQHLKVTYPPQEHQLKLHIHNTLTDRTVGEVDIDLEALKQNGAQYLPLPRSDKVLKVAQGTESTLTTPRPIQPNSPNTRFIEEREQFLKNLKHNSGVTSKQHSSRNNGTFASKLYGLLQEAKSLRKDMQHSGSKKFLPEEQELHIESDPRLDDPLVVPPQDEDGSEGEESVGSRLNIRNLQVIGSPSHKREQSEGEPLLKMSFGRTPAPY